MCIFALILIITAHVAHLTPAVGIAIKRTEYEQKTLPLQAPTGYSVGMSVGQHTTKHTGKGKRECTVIPRGWGQDDAEQILEATKRCGKFGTINLPAPYVYTIRSRLFMQLVHARLRIHGTLSFSPDIAYWIENSHRIQFQNQSTAWIIEGHDFTIDGGGWNQGGIDGNGQAWYSYARGQSNLFGRPVSLSIFNSSHVAIENFAFRDPQFWAIWIQDSNDIFLRNIYINGTNTNPAGAGHNYEVNVDGLDTLRVNNLKAENWLFRGGDDCVAPKGNSTNMEFRNFSCTGGGIAFGSIGQYKEAPDYISNISATNIHVHQPNRPHFGGSSVSGGAYFKSWVGVEAGKPPQGGGGGTGLVSNITFNNLTVHNTSQAIFVNKCYYKDPSQANACDTSTLQFKDMTFNTVKGTVSSQKGISLNCSSRAACKNIEFTGVELKHFMNHTASEVYCDNVQRVKGITCS